MHSVVEEKLEDVEEYQVQLIHSRPLHAQVHEGGGVQQLVLVLLPQRLVDTYRGVGVASGYMYIPILSTQLTFLIMRSLSLAFVLRRQLLEVGEVLAPLGLGGGSSHSTGK